MPSAPCASMLGSSSANSMFPTSSTRTPSVLTAGRSRVSSAATSLSCWRRRVSRKSASCSPVGFTRINPRRPSSASWSPGLMLSLALPAPTTAGVSRARATIAVWLVCPPTSVMIPAIFVCRSSIAASAGERSCATITASAGISSSSSTIWPMRLRTRRSATYSTSERRSRKYSSGMLSNMCFSLRATRRTAHSALMRSSAMSFRTSSTSIGSLSIRRWASRIRA